MRTCECVRRNTSSNCSCSLAHFVDAEDAAVRCGRACVCVCALLARRHRHRHRHHHHCFSCFVMNIADRDVTVKKEVNKKNFIAAVVVNRFALVLLSCLPD